jgi:hypothetical protein
MELFGTVKAIMPMKENNTFRSIEFVITDNINAQYPQHIPMQVSQGKCELLNDIKIGDNVAVSVNINGKQYQDKNTLEDKYFLSLNAWKITKK